MARNLPLRLPAIFGIAAIAIYLVGFARMRSAVLTTMPTVTADDAAFLDHFTDMVTARTAFACAFFTVAALASLVLARAKPTGAVLLTAGLLTPFYLLGLYLVYDANPAQIMLWLEADAFTSWHVDEDATNPAWSQPALAAVLGAAAVAQLWGTLRLARGVEAAPSPTAASLFFRQPAFCAAYVAVCCFDTWLTSVTAPPPTPEESYFAHYTSTTLIKLAWNMTIGAAIALTVASGLTVAMGVAARRGRARVLVLVGMLTPAYVLGLVALVAVGPLGPIGPEMSLTSSIRPVWHVPLLAVLAGGAMVSYVRGLFALSSAPLRV
ncbi:hypothetical protein ACFOY2_37250 [Nonomuraea purpurea]|uniref:Uncharacterized protein n=1 Tax=Nonomuraea purpurea TaxID=1849276 RepID=A0ABV8GJ23_9ACTN